jgi:hypothetical protein
MIRVSEQMLGIIVRKDVNGRISVKVLLLPAGNDEEVRCLCSGANEPGANQPGINIHLGLRINVRRA